MNREELIRARLSVLQPVLIEIVDDSHLHAGHAGARDGGGHYQLRIVSAHFIGKSVVERHRMVYSALGELLKREIHAINVKACTPEECKP